MSLLWLVHIDSPQNLKRDHTVPNSNFSPTCSLASKSALSYEQTSLRHLSYFWVIFRLSVVDGMWPVSVYFSPHIWYFQLRVLTTLDNLTVIYFRAKDMCLGRKWSQAPLFWNRERRFSKAVFKIEIVWFFWIWKWYIFILGNIEKE